MNKHLDNGVRLEAEQATSDKASKVVEIDQFNKWIPVTERLPEERDSIFKRFHGTKLWQDGMFLTVSNTVLASVLKEDGTRTVKAMHTQGGEWNLDSMPWAKCVTHWMPLPEPPKEDV